MVLARFSGTQQSLGCGAPISYEPLPCKMSYYLLALIKMANLFRADCAAAWFLQ